MKRLIACAIGAGFSLGCVLLGCSQQPESLKKDIVRVEPPIELARQGFGFEAGRLVDTGTTVDVEMADYWAFVATEDGGDAVVARHRATNKMPIDFSRTFTSSTGVEVVDMAASSAGYAVLLKSASAIDIDGQSYSGDGVLAVFSQCNQLLFVRSYTGFTPIAVYEPLAVAMDDDGRVAMVGGTIGPVEVDTGVIVVGGSSGFSAKQPILAVYDTSGSAIFAHSSQGANHPLGHTFDGVEFDSSGRVVIAGAHRSSAGFGPCSLGGIAYSKPHVVVFNTDGSCAISYEPVASIVVAVEHSQTEELAVAANSVAIRGQLPPSPEYLDFGGGPVYGPGKFLARFDGNMNLVYAKKVTQDMDFITTRDDGHVVIASSFTGTIDLGTGPITSPGANTSIVLSELDSAGVTIDAGAILPNTTPQHPTGLAAFPNESLLNGRVLLTGQYFTSGAASYDFLVGYSSD